MIQKLIQGDALQELKTIPDASVDLVVTSPPYADKRKNAYESVQPDLYADWLFNISQQLMRVIKDQGSVIVNVKEGCHKGTRQKYVLQYLLKMAEKYLWIDTFIWNKTNPLPTGSKKRLKDSWENCFHFAKTTKYKFFPLAVSAPTTSAWAEGQKKRKNKNAYATKNGSGFHMKKRCTNDQVRPGNVLTGAKSCLNLPHPAVFPPYLPTFFIKLMSEPGDTVLDPFAGSGTTLLAAKELKRNYIGIELSPPYVTLAQERLKKIP